VALYRDADEEMQIDHRYELQEDRADRDLSGSRAGAVGRAVAAVE